MIELRILGSPDMVGADGGQLLSVLHRPKSLALLSYMAVEGLGAYQRRDKLLGLFWPEAEERKARSSLSEALSRLRQSLGPAAILSRGNEEIALSPTELWVDASALLAAADEGKLNEVARLYRGPLLDGFFLDGSLRFDHWLDSTRGRFERVALETLGTLTDAAAAVDDASAITWAERAVALSPTDAASVGRLMTLLARSDHRTSALDAFDHYERRLADERGLEPAADLVDLASRIGSGELLDDPDPPSPKSASQPRSKTPLRLVSGGPDPVVSPYVDRLPNGEELSGGSTAPGVGGREAPQPPIEAPAAPGRGLVIALAIATITLGGVAAWSSRSPESMTVVRSEITPMGESRFLLGPGGAGFTLSPNGERLVYVGEGPEGRRLWERQFGELDPTHLPGTDGASAPVFSPDGSMVAFAQEGSLKTISLAGGLPFTVLGELEGAPFLDWGSDGLIYYSRGTDIYRVPAAGGRPEQVTTEFEGASARLPHVLPDGRGLLVTLRKSWYSSMIGVVGPDGGQIRELFEGTAAQYAPSGHIVYATLEGELMAVPFDLDRLEHSGSAVAIQEGVLVRSGASTAEFALSEAGSLVYFAPGPPPSYQAVWVDRTGSATEIDPSWTFVGDSRWSSLALSPTGDRLALSVPGAGVDIWIKNLDGAPVERFTFTGRGNHRPAWSHDGEYLTYARDSLQGLWQTVRKRSDGTGDVVTLMSGGVNTAFYSRDGDWLVYATQAESSSADVFAVQLGVDSVGRAVLAGDHHEFNPVLSPDGRWLAYNSDESGRFEVYVRSFPDVGSLKRQVSTEGGSEALWSRSGQELFYRNGAGELVAAQITDEPTFSVRAQTVLFSAERFLASASHPIYDVRPDDQAFVMLRSVAGEPDRLILVQNLFESR